MDVNAILKDVRSGTMDIKEAEELLKKLPYEDLGYAKIDHHRNVRQGFEEVIYCQGKETQHLVGICRRMAEEGLNVLGTRASKEQAEAVLRQVPEFIYEPVSRLLKLECRKKELIGKVVVCTGGTADIPVAEEAAGVAEFFGTAVTRLFDVGVAGIHRLLGNLDVFEHVNCVVAVAGMEGALPGVVAGLVDVPVIAVPTSIGYGASFGGLSALLTMINSCANGITVVNIDNGYGAGYVATQINRLAVRGNEKLFRLFKSRLVLVGLAILLQVLWWALFMSRLTSYSVFFNVFFQLISIGILLYLIRKDENSAYKIAWIILVMGVPLFGGVLYLMVGNKKPSKRLAVKMAAVKMEMKEALSQNQWILKEIRAQDPAVAGNLHYIGEFGAYPVWKNTEVSYFSVGEQMFASMLEDLRKAEHYIFLEYFIIQEGLMWDWILEILEQKVKEGVDVRLIYDDVGCVSLLPVHYANIMEQKGIKCLAFNRFVPFVSLVMNNRDHRKIMVIDGHTAYNGGINLADEYINKKLRFGHWKDTGVRLHGDAVFNFTLMFLEVWNAFRSPDLDYEIFRPHRWHPEHFTGSGYVAPYADTPLDNESLGENVYINILNQAKEYVYIATPYLLISDEMENALCLAAKRGVDVRILMPGIPDKPMVFFMAKSYYPPLLKAGVQIYEYTPGFVHAKSYVCDDRIATVGTINMDFRSLYLHFECGTFLYDCSAVLDVKKDMEDCFPKCHQVSIGDCRQGMVGNMITSVLRVLAPLM